MRIKALLLANNRSDLLAHSIDSLVRSLHGYNYTLISINHDGNINEGRAKLLSHIDATDEWILSTEDDFLFNEPRNTWLSDAITLLQKNPDVGKIRLRRSGDGQREEKVVEKRSGIDIVTCWRSGFSHNPHICHANLYRKLLPVPKTGHLETEFGKRYNATKLKTAKLNNYKHYGVATHIGGGRGINF